ncbi:MAG: nickel pincer cofactor biosynthesis protein LarB [Chloroflexota bacterium]|nr:nickel pincer cofactor biosynthesis protein LarB [Chloroflexota bacterium]
MQRLGRTGIPEVVYAESKPAPETLSSLLRLADSNGGAIASRCPDSTMEYLRQEIAPPFELVVHELARVAVVRAHGREPRVTGGRIGVICAGTSDNPIAEEAALMAIEMGCAVELVSDVGVAGLHRLVAPLSRLMDSRPGLDALIVAAGMDGALPSVVAGLVDVPIIGLPVSVGYGFGGDGVGALMAMLQSCAPGLAVVNIDNGIGAGAIAARIANRAAGHRSHG